MEHHHHPKESGHDHSHGHHHHHGDNGYRNLERRRLLAVMILTGSMMIIEVVGGVISNSLALISDAGHMLTHFFALTVSYIAIRIASRPTGPERSFGLYRMEVLAARFNAVTLILITAYIFYEAYHRFLTPEPIAEVQMFVIALAGLIVNLVSAVLLHKASKDDLNVKSAFLHMVGDTASSFGVVGGAVIIYFTGWYIIDPLLSVLIGGVILIWVWGLLRDSIRILLESTPKHIKVAEVENEIRGGFKEVLGVHDIHIWEITSKMYAMTGHVEVEGNKKINELTTLRRQIQKLLDKKFDIGHVNIQFECSDSK